MVDKEVVTQTCSFMAQRVDEHKSLLDWKDEGHLRW
jgi:hypothetical protein